MSLPDWRARKPGYGLRSATPSTLARCEIAWNPVDSCNGTWTSDGVLHTPANGSIGKSEPSMSAPGGAIGNDLEHRHSAAWQEILAALPGTTFDAGETVVREGTKSGRLLILKNGAVSVVKNGIEIAAVTQPGAVFGELSVLLDEPHTADVRTIEPSEFLVADANILLTREPSALLYVATLLARRLDLANRGLIEIKSELAAGAPPNLIRSTIGKIESLISFISAGYGSTGAVHSIR
jgi:CRP/FNR family cyclic AMP-dependent transcriptional regulator